MKRNARLAPRCSAVKAKCLAGPDLDTLAEESVYKNGHFGLTKFFPCLMEKWRDDLWVPVVVLQVSALDV